MMAASVDVLRADAVQRDARSQSLSRAASRLETLTAWALVGPAVILLVGLFLLPCVFAVIVIALTDWQLGGRTFIRRPRHFREVLAMRASASRLSNTVVYVLIVAGHGRTGA